MTRERAVWILEKSLLEEAGSSEMREAMRMAVGDMKDIIDGNLSPKREVKGTMLKMGDDYSRGGSSYGDDWRDYYR